MNNNNDSYFLVLQTFEHLFVVDIFDFLDYATSTAA